MFEESGELVDIKSERDKFIMNERQERDAQSKCKHFQVYNRRDVECICHHLAKQGDFLNTWNSHKNICVTQNGITYNILNGIIFFLIFEYSTLGNGFVPRELNRIQNKNCHDVFFLKL